LGVNVKRVQLRAMRNKWGSISTAGTLTLANDLLDMPRRLVEYVVCHELLHLKVPTHNRLYRLLLNQHIPDWRERERELGRRGLEPIRITQQHGMR
jgi:predicted metal-dependent hydrolase